MLWHSADRRAHAVTAKENAVIELIIVYCLSSDTKTCIEKRVPLDSFTSPMGCTMSGQQRAQEYLREHPAYALKSWRCEINMPRQTLNLPAFELPAFNPPPLDLPQLAPPALDLSNTPAQDG